MVTILNNRFFAARNLISLQYYFGVATKNANTVYNLLKTSGAIFTDITKTVVKLDLSPQLLSKVKDFDYGYADDIIKTCNENAIRLLLITDDEYPERLLNIEIPPLVIFYKGNFPQIDDEPAICVVGPREVSDFGAKASYALSYRFAKAGFIVVSGAAKGSDAAAHRAAMEAGGKTIGLLGCGLLTNYLPQNKTLREQIAENCCLLSEYPPNYKTTRYTFPIRNRIMSALSLGTVVIEGDEGSGAISTANHAIEQGKDVFVIPGNPTLKHYKGSNNLLRDGAIPLLDTSDVFNVYIPKFCKKLNLEKAFEPIKRPNVQKTQEKVIKIEKNYTEGLSNEAQIVYNYIDKQKFTADDLLGCKLSNDEILTALTELEMEQLIETLPGGMYKKY